jgi:HAD superfamily hydrolase (TIGR01509 family)
MSRIEGIIFDCDGVLFESRAANLAYYNRILEHFCYQPVHENHEERAHLCHTASSPDVLAVLMNSEDLQPALDYAATLDYREFIPQMQPEPHLVSVLEKLSHDYPLAIATNRGASVEPILNHFDLERFFSAIITSQDVDRPKPAPDMLLLASSRLGADPENCLFIGDSELDRQAAEDANVNFAGYGGLASGGISLQNHLQLLDFLTSTNE